MKVPLAVRAMPRFATRAWFTPPPLSSRRRETWEANTEDWGSFSVDVSGQELKGIERGNGPTVFLVHGWGGRAAQMADLGNSISRRGFRVVAVNAPGHGDATLDRTDIFEMAAAVGALVNDFGQPHAIVAHSLGAMATVHALRDSLPQKVVFIAPVLDVGDALVEFARRAQLYPWTARSLNRRIRKYIGDHWDEMAAGEELDLGAADVLVVHDPDDGDTPFRVSASLAYRSANTELLVTSGLGHSGALKDPKVADAIASFVAGIRGVSGLADAS